MAFSQAFLDWEEATEAKGISIGEQRGISIGEQRGISIVRHQCRIRIRTIVQTMVM